MFEELYGTAGVMRYQVNIKKHSWELSNLDKETLKDVAKREGWRGAMKHMTYICQEKNNSVRTITWSALFSQGKA